MYKAAVEGLPSWRDQPDVADQPGVVGGRRNGPVRAAQPERQPRHEQDDRGGGHREQRVRRRRPRPALIVATTSTVVGVSS